MLLFFISQFDRGCSEYSEGSKDNGNEGGTIREVTGPVMETSGQYFS
jgi:hypothetical protein